MSPSRSGRNAPRPLRIAAVDDGPFDASRAKGKQTAALVVAFCLGSEIEKVGLSRIRVDGVDATRSLLWLLRKGKFDVVLLSGVTFAGFNVADPWIVRRKFGKSVIIVTGDRPRNRAVRVALQKHFPDWKRRWSVFARLSRVYSAKTKRDEPALYFEPIGIQVERARNILKTLSANSRLPEPIRIAGLVARGLGLIQEA